MELPITTEFVSAIAAILASVFAYGTMKSTENLARSRNTLDLLLAVEVRIAALSEFETKSMQEELLSGAASKGQYSDAAQAYQQALNIFDILAFAIDNGGVDAAQAKRYLQRLGASAPALNSFIKQYRIACGDEGVYGALETLLSKLESPIPKWLRP